MSTVLITGGTGLVGRALTPLLIEKGYEVIILTRKASTGKQATGVSYAEWDINKGTIDLGAIQKADHIIHLAGAGVFDKRWTKAYKKEIVDSRVKSGELLVKCLSENEHKVKTFISSSAIGWYGADKGNSKPFVESDPAEDGFLGETCQLWEESVQPVKQMGIRLTIVRTGIVLSNDGGFLAPVQKGLKFGIAAITGTGSQVMSWIHIEDLCRIFIFAIENDGMAGVYNAVAPHPASMKELVLKEANLLKGNFYIPSHVPAFMLKIGLGERSIEALKSTTVSSGLVKSKGFHFVYPSLEAALAALKQQQ